MMFFFLIAIVALFSFYHLYWKRRLLPPGPTPLPLIGNLLHLIRRPPGEGAFREWRDQYGPVYTYWLGELPVVGVNDLPTMTEAFVNSDACNGRPIMKWHEYIRGSQAGPAFSEGAVWQQSRRFVLQVLRDFGMGKNLMEEKILTEVQIAFDEFDEAISVGDKAINLSEKVDVCVGSVISSFIFGYTFHGEKRKEFTDLKHNSMEFTRLFGDPLVAPTLQNPNAYLWIPVVGSRVAAFRDAGLYVSNFVQNRIADHVGEYDAETNDVPTDFIEAVLQERAKSKESGETGDLFDDKQIHAMCSDLWIAGQETTSKTIGWGLAYLLCNPEVQRKCQEELDRVVGSDRLITVADRANLNYCHATTLEVTRVANLLPQNLVHRTHREVVVGGYRIPAGASIVPQISVMLCDENHFPEPEKFQPERYIDKETGKLLKNDALMPFGIGKRQCLGESLARMELFLIIVNILNRYEMHKNSRLPSLKRSPGGTVEVEPFRSELRRRLPA